MEQPSEERGEGERRGCKRKTESRIGWEIDWVEVGNVTAAVKRRTPSASFIDERFSFDTKMLQMEIPSSW